MYLRTFVFICALFAYGETAVDIFERVEQEPNQFIAIDFFSPVDDHERTPVEDENSIFAQEAEEEAHPETPSPPVSSSINQEKLLFAELPKMKQANHSRSMADYFHAWHLFKIEHGKKYTTFQEEKDRFQTFIANFEHIRLHNIAYKLGIKSYTTKLNEYADMTHEEFKKTMNGFKRSLMDRTRNDNLDRRPFRIPLNFQAPDEVDWRDQGYVTPVKNQGHCGSCWAFSATGSLEGQHKRETGKLVSLSEQNLVDCSSKFGNEGCNGGLMDNAFQYIKQNKGVDTENSYPYEAKDGKCRFKKESVGADDVGFVDIESGNETALQLALASQGPISVAIDAGHKSFQFYEKGVYYEPKCSSEDLDHGVLAVGYGVNDEDAAYWLIKNSWGTTWGEDGYIKIARNRHNHCGVATQASYPSV